MRRTSWSRALVALFALSFTLYRVEPAALHACAVHDAPAATEDASHGGHDMHATHSASTPDTGQPSDHASCCTCPGDCAAVSPAALATTSGLPVVVTAATTDTGLPNYEYVPVAAAHVLPFANGPPTRG